jgi:hypothetical protein
MAAPKGNQFWKIRSSHGRDKLFATPELLWEAAQEYFNWVDAHPLYKAEAIMSGKEAGKIIKVPVGRPYTITGLLIYIDASESFWKDFRKASHEDFSSIISTIEKIIFTQKFEGAAIGAFNGNLISRELGLADKKELTGKDGERLIPETQIPNFDHLTIDQIESLLSKYGRESHQDNSGS